MFGSQSNRNAPIESYSLNPSQTSQSDQGLLCPYFAGYQTLKVIWVTPPMNVNAIPVQTSSGGKGGGKGSSGSSSTQYRWYADLMGKVAMGPASSLINAQIDSNYIFWGTSGDGIPGSGLAYFFDGAQGASTIIPLNATVDGTGIQYGNMLLSWGTEQQGPPNFCNWGSALRGWDRGKIRVEFKQMYAGSIGRTSWPNVQFFMGRAPVVPGYAYNDTRLLNPCSLPGSFGYGANPIAIIYELLSNTRWGAGIPAAAFDMAFITSQINSIATAYGTGVWISPLIDSQQPLRSVIQTVLEYFDGFIAMRNGLIRIGWYQHSSGLSPVATFNLDQMVSKPKITTHGFSNTINECLLTWTDWVSGFQPTTNRMGNAAIVIKTNGVRNVALQRPWITNYVMAHQYGWEYCRYRSYPQASGQIEVRKADGLGVGPGDLILCQLGDWGAQLLARITDMTVGEEKADSVKLTLAQEMGTFDSQYTPPPNNEFQGIFIKAGNTNDQKAVSLPGALRVGDRIEMAFLCERLSPTDMGFFPWISSDGVTFNPTNVSCNFAVRGHLQSNMGHNFDPLEFDPVGASVFLQGIDRGTLQPQSADQAANFTLLGFVDDEILSIQGFTAQSGGYYKITCIRGCYGSTIQNHVQGARIFFIYRNNIVPIAWPQFFFGKKFYNIIQPFTATGLLPVSDAIEYSFVVGYNPSQLYGVTNLSVGVDGQYVVFGWTPDPGNDVAGYEIRYGPVNGNWQQATVADTGITSSKNVTAIIPPGTWQIYVASYSLSGSGNKVYAAEIASVTFTVPVFFALVELNYGPADHGLDEGALQVTDWDQANGSILTECWVHPTAWILIPNDQQPASYVGPDHGFDVFDNFAVSYPAECSFLSRVIDSKGSGSNIRSSSAVYEYLAGFSGEPVTGESIDINLTQLWGNKILPSGVTLSITGGWVHPTTGQVLANSSQPASYSGPDNGFEVFDNFCFQPVATTTVQITQVLGGNDPCLFDLETTVIPTPDGQTFDVQSEIWTSQDGIAFVEQQTGSAGEISFLGLASVVEYVFVITNTSGTCILTNFDANTTISPPQYWETIAADQRSTDDATFATWGPWISISSQFVDERYVQFQLAFNPLLGIVPESIKSLWMLLDEPSLVIPATTIAVPAGGIAITFPAPYRQSVNVKVSVVGSFPPVTAMAQNPTLTGFTFVLYSVDTGLSVAGTGVYEVTGI